MWTNGNHRKTERQISYDIPYAAKSLQSCPTLCDPIDGSPQGSPVPGILQARTLEWVAISFSNAWKWKVKSESEVAQSCLTLSKDCSLPGSSVHGIFQARVLEGKVKTTGPPGKSLQACFLCLWVCVCNVNKFICIISLASIYKGYRRRQWHPTPVLWPPDVKNWLIWNKVDAGNVWRLEEKGMTADEMVGWHHWLGHEFEQAPGDGDG